MKIKAKLNSNPTFRRIAYFFPFQLVFVTFKKNQTLLLFWLLFFGLITQSIAAKYGLPFLFLDPEYMDDVNFTSFFIMGFSCGGFIMAFNISSYIMNGYRFPFLATLTNPFIKFCYNNSIIPGIFVIVYFNNIVFFQNKSGGVGYGEAMVDGLSFLSGVLLFVIFSITYFFRTNKDIFKMFGLKNDDPQFIQDRLKKTSKIFMKKNLEWKEFEENKKEARDWHIETYFSFPFKIKLARSTRHYEKEMLMQVFRQNHRNATIFELLTIITILLLGLFREVPFLEIPAGSSLFLLFTMIMMVTSAMYTMLRGWSSFVLIAILIGLNFAYQYKPFNYRNPAYGLNYETKANFTYDALKKLDTNGTHLKNDIAHGLQILQNWKLKNIPYTYFTVKKPKIIFVNVSGGGLRSSLWTVYSLQYADSILDGQLLPHIHMITGSSGGIIGASYLREAYLRELDNNPDRISSSAMRKNISKDILNPVTLSIAVNDIVLRLQRFSNGKYSYIKDRAYAFEDKLNKNTGYFLNKRLIDYKKPEEESRIPMIVITPTIINDGRRLIISPQPVSYLTRNNSNKNISNRSLVDGIEFTRFFEGQDPYNLMFTSALRMNATFPYILPYVSLPSQPVIDVMDAGVRDNYGVITTLKFLSTFKNWIQKNTSGVILIQIRDRYKEFPIDDNPLNTITKTLSTPVGSVYNNLFSIQDFNHDQLLQYASLWFKDDIDIIDFQLRNDPRDRISLSWHLTAKEKKKVLNSINMPENQESIRKLKKLME